MPWDESYVPALATSEPGQDKSFVTGAEYKLQRTDKPSSRVHVPTVPELDGGLFWRKPSQHFLFSDKPPNDIADIAVWQDLNTLISNFKAQFNDNLENRRRWGGGRGKTHDLDVESSQKPGCFMMLSEYEIRHPWSWWLFKLFPTFETPHLSDFRAAFRLDLWRPLMGRRHHGHQVAARDPAP